jgi:hypothetical protein
VRFFEFPSFIHVISPSTPTGILITGWNTSQQEVPTPIFNTECAIKLQEFEWFLVQHHIPREVSPAWTKAYNCSRFANAFQRIFGEGNYEFYIGTTQGISGNHQIISTNTKGPKDFLQDKQSLYPTTTPHLLA